MKTPKKSAKAKAETNNRIREVQRETEAYNAHQTALDEILQKYMMKKKGPVYTQDIEVMYRTFDRIYDKKNYSIRNHWDLKRTADEQHQRTIASFSEVRDGIIGDFLADLESMYKLNEVKHEIVKQGLD